MTVAKSMIDVAYDIMSKKKRSIAFNKLWEEVSKICKSPSEFIGRFYSDLKLDPRFVSLKDNKWDLKERHSFEESHVDLSNIELDDDDIEIYENEDDEENIRNKEEDY